MSNQQGVPCGIAIPQIFPDGPVDMTLIRDYVERAELLGYHSLWVQEDIIGDTSSLEPINLLCYIAAVTQNIRLGTSVIVATTRNPVILAKEFSTLDQLSNGRLIIGISLGGRPNLYPILGGPTEKRVRHFVDSLNVMKALWEQSEAKYDGHFWTLDGEPMEPKPVQKPYPPLWFGGRNADGLRRAVRHGDGWMGAGSSSTEEFKSHVGIIRESWMLKGVTHRRFIFPSECTSRSTTTRPARNAACESGSDSAIAETPRWQQAFQYGEALHVAWRVWQRLSRKALR